MIEKYEKRCSVAFTGHRFISSGRVEEVRESVNNEIRLLYSKGFRNFFCGMALGFDMLAAEEVLKLKEELPAILLVATVPYREQNERWGANQKKRYLEILDRVVICIPSGVTEVERRAVREATLKAGARQVSVIEEPMAAAIGAGLPISEPTGSMIVDIGGGTAEIAVISLGGIVASRSVRMAGDMFDQAIIAFIKRKYNLLIGERTAEQIKIEIGSAYPMDPEMTMEIKGRNLVDGLPKNIVVHSEDVREALLECLVKITSAIKETLERTPPELSADIIDHGITLTGGGALLRGLDQLIQSETGIDVHVAEDPLDCVAKGAGAVLDHVDVLHDVLDTDGAHM